MAVAMLRLEMQLLQGLTRAGLAVQCAPGKAADVVTFSFSKRTDGATPSVATSQTPGLYTEERRDYLLALSPHPLLCASGAPALGVFGSSVFGGVWKCSGDRAVSGLSTAVAIRMQMGNYAMVICRDGRDDRPLKRARYGILIVFDRLSPTAVLHAPAACLSRRTTSVGPQH
jgi:hypothetical protein